jgi:hypothetical protein
MTYKETVSVFRLMWALAPAQQQAQAPVQRPRPWARALVRLEVLNNQHHEQEKKKIRYFKM